MNYKQVVRHFGGLTKTAQALGLKRQNVHNWGQRERVPARWQVKIEHLSCGALRADAQARREALEIAAYVQR